MITMTAIKSLARKIKKMIRTRMPGLYTFMRLAVYYPLIYISHAWKPVDEKKVIIYQVAYSQLNNNFFVLYEKLKEAGTYDIHVHIPFKDDESRKNIHDLIVDCANAKYIFLNDATTVFSRIPFRKETIIVQLWHACGAFKKFGFGTAELLYGPNRKNMEQYPQYAFCDIVTVSSPEAIWAFSEAMGLDSRKIKPWGVSRTDLLFSEEYRTAACDKLYEFMPSAKSKKIILYAPTFRGHAGTATASTLSLLKFHEVLADKYVLVIKYHPNVQHPPVVPKEYSEFAVDLTKCMDIEELLCVADICISDYSSLIFEYSLFEKPMIFFAYDLEEYYDWHGFYYDYNEFTPGPVFKTNEEMVDYIQHIDERFDRQQVVDFREKFMSACDGHATERILKNVMGIEFDHCKLESGISEEY